MIRLLIAVVGIGAALSMAVSCSSSTSDTAPATSEDAPFLTLCRGGCPDGLECRCGICTTWCQANARCSNWGGAICTSPMPIPGVSCGGSNLCDVVCDTDADCAHLAIATSCVFGRCREPEHLDDAGSCASRTNIKANVGKICVVSEHDDGSVAAGDALKVRIAPSGCYPSSCITVQEFSCEVDVSESGDVEARGSFCLSTSEGRNGCTADCNARLVGECQAKAPLTEGTHTISLGDLSVTLTVPGVLPSNVLCAL